MRISEIKKSLDDAFNIYGDIDVCVISSNGVIEVANKFMVCGYKGEQEFVWIKK